MDPQPASEAALVRTVEEFNPRRLEPRKRAGRSIRAALETQGMRVRARTRALGAGWPGGGALGRQSPRVRRATGSHEEHASTPGLLLCQDAPPSSQDCFTVAAVSG